MSSEVRVDFIPIPHRPTGQSELDDSIDFFRRSGAYERPFFVSPGSWHVFEEAGMFLYHFDKNSFLLAAQDMHGFELTALDALQRGWREMPSRAMASRIGRKPSPASSLERDVHAERDAPRTRIRP